MRRTLDPGWITTVMAARARASANVSRGASYVEMLAGGASDGAKLPAWEPSSSMRSLGSSSISSSRAAIIAAMESIRDAG